MGASCYDCGEKFGRCYEHGGDCPAGCDFGKHDCPGGWDGSWSQNDLVYEVGGTPVPKDALDW